MKKLFVLVLLLAVSAGCSATRSSVTSAGLNVEAKSELKADVAVNEKISGSASLTNLCLAFWCFQLSGPTKFADGVNYGSGSTGSSPFGNMDPFSGVKSAAAYDAVSKSNADVIIAPRYVIETNNFLIFQTVNATVSGYKGTVKGFK